MDSNSNVSTKTQKHGEGVLKHDTEVSLVNRRQVNS